MREREIGHIVAYKVIIILRWAPSDRLSYLWFFFPCRINKVLVYSMLWTEAASSIYIHISHIHMHDIHSGWSYIVYACAMHIYMDMHIAFFNNDNNINDNWNKFQFNQQFARIYTFGSYFYYHSHHYIHEIYI